MEYDMVRKSIIMDKHLFYELDRFAKKEQRDFSNALRYTARIGLIALDNPELTIEEIKDILEAQVDYEAGRMSELKLEKS
jgi:metal-responsive CopG/Arc/MetJ family transcriptional regulator